MIAKRKTKMMNRPVLHPGVFQLVQRSVAIRHTLCPEASVVPVRLVVDQTVVAPAEHEFEVVEVGHNCSEVVEVDHNCSEVAHSSPSVVHNSPWVDHNFLVVDHN